MIISTIYQRTIRFFRYQIHLSSGCFIGERAMAIGLSPLSTERQVWRVETRP